MPQPIRPRRSVLYVPGSNERALEKAKGLPVDCLIVDLEDSVAAEAKADARAAVARIFAEGGTSPQERIIRINAPATEWGEADLAIAAAARSDAILVPKVSSGEDLARLRSALAAAKARKGTQLWAMMETPLAILRAEEIARSGADEDHPLTVLVMGTNDLAKETRAALQPDRAPMLASLTIAVLAARAYGLDVIDGVYNDFKDLDGFRAECLHGRSLGMDGKTLIHPGQVATCNEIFSPGVEEVATARRIIAAFELPENARKGAISLDGRMVERLHRDMARRTVAIAEAIAARS